MGLARSQYERYDSQVEPPRYSGTSGLQRREVFVGCTESLLSQTFSDFELIISDNASTDQTSDVCERYKNCDGRIRYFRKSKNEGAARNYNFTVEQARGEYFRSGGP